MESCGMGCRDWKRQRFLDAVYRCDQSPPFGVKELVAVYDKDEDGDE